MSSLEQNIRKVTPYVPGEQPRTAGIIKLNTNENPYPPSPFVQQAVKEFQEGELRLYPDPTSEQLVHALAVRHGLEDSQVFVGVGSDDVLAMCFLTFFNSQKPILFPDITYSFYDVWAKLYRIPYRTPALDAQLQIKAEDYLCENGGIIFPNPNAPTGVYETLDLVEEIVRQNQDVIVIVDEAYIDFGGKSAIGLLEKYENLLVVQTFSKSRSMAGMRIGYACGSSQLIRYLNDVKYSFNSYTMSRMALALGAASVADETYFQETIARVTATRERVKKELADIGFSFPDSKANFLFVTHPEHDAEALFELLKKENIYVRFFKKPVVDQYLRITIGTDEQMDALLAVLRRV